MINYYRILSIPENSPELNIKKAYRKLAIKHHPDKTKKNNTEEFIKIKKAYEILINSNTRKKYDEELYKFRNPNTKFNEVDLEKLNDTFYENETVGSKILNFIIRLAFAAIFITVTVYSCEFIDNNILRDNRNTIEYDSNINRNEPLSDSLKNEDLKIQNQLKNSEEKKQTNGEIKF